MSTAGASRARVRPLEAIHEAALALTSELSLSRVLQKTVHLARDLAGARYAALIIPGPTGEVEQFLVSGLTDDEVAAIGTRPEGKGLLGALLESKQPIRLRDLRQHPRSAGFCENHPVMTSLLSVPILARGELLGRLYITNKIGGDEFDDIDQHMIEMLAAHAAVAIENARLYQQVQRMAILEERERIGMDLHDGIIQSIYAVGLTLEHGRRLMDDDPDKAREYISMGIDGLNHIIQDIRTYILDLRPQRLRADDLVGSLEQLVEEFRANTLADIRLEVAPGVDRYLSADAATALFHIAQEALANAARHAMASHLEVSLRRKGRHIILTVRDDGVGFDADVQEPVVGHGLSNMALRASAIGGRLGVRSVPNQGTTVTATVPVDAEKR